MTDTSARAKSSGAAERKDEEQIALAKTLHQVPWCEQYERMISGMLYIPIFLSHNTPTYNV